MADETVKSDKPRHIGELIDGELMSRLDVLDVLSRKVLQGKIQGQRQSKRRGAGAEFADHRPYTVGDDLRHVDWNIYGRLDQLFVKIFLEEQDLSVQILADNSLSMTAGTEEKELSVKRLAAALGYVALVNNSRLSMSLFADGITVRQANMRGRHNVSAMAGLLLGNDADGPSNFDKAARQLTSDITGNGVMIVISDFMFKEGYEQGLRRLLNSRYELFVIQLLSPSELSPDITGDLKLIDIEDGDAAEITISRSLLNYYKRTLSAYCNEIKNMCIRAGATYMLTDSSVPTQTLMLNYLRRRGLVGGAK